MDTNKEIEELKAELLKVKAENQQLKTNLEEFRLAVENSPATIVVTDSDGKIEYANPVFEEITGYQIQEVVGQTPRIFKSGYHDNEFYAQLWKQLKSGQHWEGVFYNRRKDGSFYWEQAFIGPIKNENEKITHFVAVKLDITYKKEAEAQLEEINHRLEENNAAKDKLFSIVAHDLRNPFWTILSFSELMAKNISFYSIEDIQKMCEMMNRSAQQVYALVEDLLQWARSQSGHIEAKASDDDLFACVYDAMTTHSQQAAIKGIKLINLVKKGVKVWADDYLLSTILRNLISNSIKFTQPGGQISVSYQLVNHEAEITVADTGIGISPDGIDKLFKIENKSSTRGTSDESGTGLGLILCKEFVEKHGGKIWVESKVGEGSQFKFTLPYKTN
jgi:PAS domain S-box-containing protein